MQRITLRHILISKTYTMQWEISNSCARYSAKKHNDSLTHSDKCGKINVNFTKNSLFQLEKWKIYSHGKNISSNQLFSKNVIFTKFLQKMYEMRVARLISHKEEISIVSTSVCSHTLLTKMEKSRNGNRPTNQKR